MTEKSRTNIPQNDRSVGKNFSIASLPSSARENGLKESPKPASDNQENKKSDIVTSLSYDQVNDRPEELVELRGEGRYFGVTDPETGETINAQQRLGPLCANCHRRGHTRAKCTTVVCHKCGVVGEHYESQCPTTLVCSRCGNKGHRAFDCNVRAKKRQYCRRCDTFSHSDDTCPSIWRSYLTLPTLDTSKRNNNQLPLVCCYNCASEMHYGDECPEQRTSRVPNISGSAFSGNNLPQQWRQWYFDRLRGRYSGYKGRKNENHAKTQNTPKGNYYFFGKDTRSKKPSYSKDHIKSPEAFGNTNFISSKNKPNKAAKLPVPSNSGFFPKFRPPSASHRKDFNTSKPTKSGLLNRKNVSSRAATYEPTRSGLIENSKSRAAKLNFSNIRSFY